MPHKKRNWSEYNRKQIKEGEITLWVDQELLRCPYCEQKGRGRPKFSDQILIVGLSLKIAYNLSYRRLQGFMTSLFALLKVSTPVPHYTLYSKRMKDLHLPKISNKRPSHILVDASGVKVFGEGEWKVKVHGTDKRRTWVKLHIGVDANSQDVIAVRTTPNTVGDSTMLPEVLEACPKTVRTVTADGAYDGLPCREFLDDRGIEDIIFPPKNAVPRPEPAMRNRNQMLAAIEALGGGGEARALLKKLTGYHKRSLVETAFSRLKRRFGEKFSGRRMENISVEAHMKFWILNKQAV